MEADDMLYPRDLHAKFDQPAPSRNRLKSRVIDEHCLQNCTIQFLTPSSQNWEPKRQLLFASGEKYSGQARFPNSLKPASLRANQVANIELDSTVRSLHSSRIDVINRVLSAYGEPNARLRHVEKFRNQSTRLPGNGGSQTLRTSITPVSKDKNTSQVVHPQILLETGARAGSETQIQSNLGALPIDGIVDKYMKSLAKDVTMSNQIVGSIGQAVRDSIQQNAAAVSVMSDIKLINEVLKRLLSGHLSRALAPALIETITDSTEDTASYLFQRYLTVEMTGPLERGLVKSLTSSLTTTIPKFVNSLVPKHVSRLLVKNLGHVLPRSISHSLVPALVHTLTHSPLQDYYCYYCFHHKIYCQYCQYSPSQLFYALYYTGYYSTYYTDYYQEWMVRKMAQENPSKVHLQ